MIGVESLYLAAIVHGLLQVAVLLLSPRGNRRANSVLAVLVGAVVLCMWNLQVYEADLPRNWLLFDYYYWSSIFLWGPALYIYAGLISAQLRPALPLFLRHFSPAGLLIAFQFPLYVMSSRGWIGAEPIAWLGKVILLAFYAHMAAYFYASFQLLRAYDRRLKDNYSRIDTINLSWLNRLMAVFAMAVLADLVLTGAAMAQGGASPYVAAYLTAEAIAVFAIGYFSLSHPEVLIQQAAEAETPKPNAAPLESSLAADLSAKLSAAMHDAQAYKKNDLRLSELAAMVGVSRSTLSQFINQHQGKSFYDYINEFRVRSAAESLAADERANIEKVAFDSGFNNRVSFNNAFNKFMRTTPSQYRRGRRAEPAELDRQQGAL